MRRLFVLSSLALVAVSADLSRAATTPSQCGATGLISSPTADTLNAGNFCMGIWTDTASVEGSEVLMVPFSLTLGLGTFWEAYGSYPNLLFNGDEAESDKGHAALGMKFRFLGKRASSFKLALDLQVQNSINDLAPELDGLTNYQYRLISSYRLSRFGIHLSGGYVENEQPGSDSSLRFENQTIYSGGIEFYPSKRLRLIAEIEDFSEKIPGQEGREEVSLGFQYYFSPHLTLNASLGVGMTEDSPDWRAIIGFSSCQGIGTYQIPVKRAVEEVVEVEEEVEDVKVSKFKALTPLVPKVKPLAAKPVTPLEVRETRDEEKSVLVKPSDRLNIPGTSPTKAQAVSPIAPVSSNGKEAESFSVVSEPTMASLYKKFRFPDFAFSYDLSELSDEGKKELAKVAEWLRNDKKWFAMKIVGHTDSVGSEEYNQKLSVGRAVQVASYLVVNEGIDAARLFVQGAGEAEPIASNADPEGRKKNRRVELLVLVPEGEEGLSPIRPIQKKTAPKVAIASEIEPRSPRVKDGTALTRKDETRAPQEREMKPETSLRLSKIKEEVIDAAGIASVPSTLSSSAVMKQFSFPSATFPYDLKTLPQSLRKELDEVIAWLSANDNWNTIRVVGHTDSIGAEIYNRTLSKQRAAAVAAYLMEKGELDRSRVQVVGAGEAHPLASNRTPQGRNANRRVEVEVVGGAEVKELSAADDRLTVPVKVQQPSASQIPAVAGADKGRGGQTLLLALEKQEDNDDSRGLRSFIIEKKAVLSDVLEAFVTPPGSFPYNVSRYTDVGEDSVEEILQAMKEQDSPFVLLVSGHTDNIGPEAYNKGLSVRRAKEVAGLLLKNLGELDRKIYVEGAGESLPKADNLRPEGRNTNRRVEVYLLRPVEEP